MSNDPSRDAKERARLLAGELREGQRGGLPLDHMDGNLAAIVEDHDSRALLGFAEQVYNRRKGPKEPDFADTQWARDRLTLAGNDAAHGAVEQGNVSKMANLTGWPEYENDASSLHTAAKLEDWLCESEQCKLIYLAALMGRGKTDLSLSFLAVISNYYKRAREALKQVDTANEAAVPTPEFAANFAVETPDEAPDVGLISDFDRLVEWGDRGDSSDTRWFIFDEASTELTAQSGSNAQDVAEIMAPFVKKMRKKGINMIVIGHDAGDVHVAIRSLADYVDKRNLKSASFYAGVNKREGVGHLFDIHKIPPVTQAGWDFSTDDLADWSWGSAVDDSDEPEMSESRLKEEIAERGARLYAQTDLNQSEVAAGLSHGPLRVTQTDISNAYNSLNSDKSQIGAD